MVIFSFLFFALSAQISVLRSSIVFWLSQTSRKVPVWVMRKTLASLASSAQAERCLACSAATGLARRSAWRALPVQIGRLCGLESQRVLTAAARGACDLQPCGHVLLSDLGSARGRKCDYTKIFGELTPRFYVVSRTHARSPRNTKTNQFSITIQQLSHLR